MSVQALTGAIAVEGIAPASKLILILLANYANDEGKCWPSQARIAREACMSERAVREHLGKLEAAGWISREARQGGGRYTSDIITLHQRQILPAADSAGGRNRPPPAADSAAYPTKEPPRGVNARARVELPDWVPADTWADYLEHRKRIRKPMTARAQELALRGLEALRDAGNDPVAVIEQSIQNGWQGLFEVKEQRNGSTTSRGGRRLSPVEAAAADRERFERANGLVAGGDGSPVGADDADLAGVPRSGRTFDHASGRPV